MIKKITLTRSLEAMHSLFVFLNYTSCPAYSLTLEREQPGCRMSPRTVRSSFIQPTWKIQTTAAFRASELKKTLAQFRISTIFRCFNPRSLLKARCNHNNCDRVCLWVCRSMCVSMYVGMLQSDCNIPISDSFNDTGALQIFLLNLT